ncbi:MAG: hypothetical protein HKN73_17335 [Gemmatimonadetes bacterium]|nr:hypothetical protein [Gemmatimonadota bacterium]
MAIFNAKSRAGSANLGTPLMLLSFGVIAGFLYWLSATAEPTLVVIDEPEDVQSGDVVSITAFSTDPTQFLDTEIGLRNVPVVTGLGPHAFWTSLRDANETAYLMHLGDDLVASGAAFNAGALVDVRGTVMVMSDSVLDAWQAAGAFAQETDRFQAEFADNFLELTMLEETMAAPEPSS